MTMIEGMICHLHFYTVGILAIMSLQGFTEGYYTTKKVLSENQFIYLDRCPDQNRRLACNPSNIDVFIQAHKKANNDVVEALSKAFIPGGCFSNHKKYCPTQLSNCSRPQNYGYSWTVSGVCLTKLETCPPMAVHWGCPSCPSNTYLCHPLGCIPMERPCNGICPGMEITIKPSKNQDNSKDIENNATNIQSWMKLTESASWDESLLDFINETSMQEIFPPSLTVQLTVKCGATCITSDEAVHRYDCGGLCQMKSDPCSAPGEAVCAQHYTLCGTDTCIDRFVQNRTMLETRSPEFYSCHGKCTHRSESCRKNDTQEDGSILEVINCQGGYWLCQDQKQCVLSGHWIQEAFFSHLCDGEYDCQDWSDESIVQCFWVYLVPIVYTSVSVLIILVVSLIVCLIKRKLGWLITCYTEVPGKSYEGNEDEMHLRGVAPEDVD